MNLSFNCMPGGLMLSISFLRRTALNEEFLIWFQKIVIAHRRDCPYCKFEKDPNTGREVGA